mmetsp:Transcript_14774/g.28970  ORF Transcript_14774/g.28970 Transcript_14774/m.28970 type:complete len:355 (-) Transcript_14774:456-1520(-)
MDEILEVCVEVTGIPHALAGIIRDCLEINWGAFGTKSRRLKGHTGAVYSVAWSRDGRLLASASEDGTVRVFDSELEFKTIVVLRHPLAVNAVAWSPDGRVLASGGDDKIVRLFDVGKNFEIMHRLSGHQRVVRSVSWSPDGTFLAAGGKEEAIKIWDVKECFELERTIEASSSSFWSIAWSPCGGVLASGSWDGDSIKLWSSRQRRRPSELRGHNNIVCSVAWSHALHFVASGSCDAVRIWEVNPEMTPAGTLGFTGSPVTVERVASRGHMGVVWAISWAEDDSALAVASSDRTVTILDARPPCSKEDAWDLPVHKHLHGHRGVIRSVAWTPACAKTRRLCSAGDEREVIVWEN